MSIEYWEREKESESAESSTIDILYGEKLISFCINTLEKYFSSRYLCFFDFFPLLLLLFVFSDGMLMILYPFPPLLKLCSDFLSLSLIQYSSFSYISISIWCGLCVKIWNLDQSKILASSYFFLTGTNYVCYCVVCCNFNMKGCTPFHCHNSQFYLWYGLSWLEICSFYFPISMGNAFE